MFVGAADHGNVLRDDLPGQHPDLQHLGGAGALASEEQVVHPCFQGAHHHSARVLDAPWLQRQLLYTTAVMASSSLVGFGSSTSAESW